jgi:hypothetical protein
MEHMLAPLTAILKLLPANVFFSFNAILIAQTSGSIQDEATECYSG